MDDRQGNEKRHETGSEAGISPRLFGEREQEVVGERKTRPALGLARGRRPLSMRSPPSPRRTTCSAGVGTRAGGAASSGACARAKRRAGVGSTASSGS
jgi:hypothetical protein